MMIGCLFLLAAASAAVTGSPTFPATDPNIVFVGRTQTVGSAVLLDMVGVHMKLRVSGATTVMVNVTATASSSGFEADYFDVIIDGERQPRPRQVTKNTASSQLLEIAHGLSPSTSHSIVFFKSTEAEWNARQPQPNYLSINSVSLDAGSLEPLDAPQPKHRIEFIGDSITAGYCNLCKSGLEGDQAESFYDTWGNRICQALDAECHACAWSGFGLVRNCCGGDEPLPVIFKRTLATVEDSTWDFSSWVPDAVVVNLGTNDHLGPVSDPFSKTFQSTYISFVKGIYQAYHNHPKFFLACGPMSTAYCPEVNGTLSALHDAGISAFFLDQRGFLNSTNTCCGHPSVAADISLAAAGSAFIAANL